MMLFIIFFMTITGVSTMSTTNCMTNSANSSTLTTTITAFMNRLFATTVAFRFTIFVTI